MGVDAGDIRVGVEEGDGESTVCKDGAGVAGEEGGERIDSMKGNFEGLCFESYCELCDYQPGKASIWKKFLLE